MNAHVAAPEHAVTHRWRPAVLGLLHSILITGVAMLWFLAIWMIVRRLTGQLQRPLGLFPLIGVATALVGVLTLLRVGWRVVKRDESPLRLLPAWIAPLPAVFLLAVAISLPGTATSALFLLWGSLFVFELLWWYCGWQWAGGPAVGDLEEPAAAPSRPAPLIATPEEAESGAWMAEEMTQQLTRIDTQDGTQAVEGVLRSRFQPAERSRSLHVAFCPPLPTVPEMTVTQCSGPRCHVRAAEVRTYGARFDLRLAAASEASEEVLIHFEAVASASSTAQASPPVQRA